MFPEGIGWGFTQNTRRKCQYEIKESWVEESAIAVTILAEYVWIADLAVLGSGGVSNVCVWFWQWRMHGISQYHNYNDNNSGTLYPQQNAFVRGQLH